MAIITHKLKKLDDLQNDIRFAIGLILFATLLLFLLILGLPESRNGIGKGPEIALPTTLSVQTN